MNKEQEFLRISDLLDRAGVNCVVLRLFNPAEELNDHSRPRGGAGPFYRWIPSYTLEEVDDILHPDYMVRIFDDSLSQYGFCQGDKVLIARFIAYHESDLILCLDDNRKLRLMLYHREGNTRLLIDPSNQTIAINLDQDTTVQPLGKITNHIRSYENPRDIIMQAMKKGMCGNVPVKPEDVPFQTNDQPMNINLYGPTTINGDIVERGGTKIVKQ